MSQREYDSLFDGADSGVFSSAGASPDGLGGSPDGLGEVEDYDNLPDDMADPDAGPRQDFNIPRGGNSYEPGESPQYPYGAMAGAHTGRQRRVRRPVSDVAYYGDMSGGPIDFIEPEDNTASRSAGLTVLLVAAAAGVGYAAKGGMGAVSGVLLAGAAANVYRAQKWWKSEDPSEKHEAIVSAVFAAGGLLAGGYVGYKAVEKSR